MELLNAREKNETGRIDAWYDKVFVKHLIKAVQGVDPGIGAVIFPEVKQIVFYWRRIIIHKVWLDEYNTETIKIEDHKKIVQSTVDLIKTGAINIKPFQEAVKGFNKNKTGKILT